MCWVCLCAPFLANELDTTNHKDQDDTEDEGEGLVTQDQTSEDQETIEMGTYHITFPINYQTLTSRE